MLEERLLSRREYPEQHVQYPAIRRLLGTEKAGQTIKMWARLGYGPPVGPSPRGWTRVSFALDPPPEKSS